MLQDAFHAYTANNGLLKAFREWDKVEIGFVECSMYPTEESQEKSLDPKL